MATATTPDARSEERRRRFRTISDAFRAAISHDAVEIRRAKMELRSLQREGSTLSPTRQSLLAKHRKVARARLIAYGLLRGMPLQRIEAGRTSLDQLPFSVLALVRQITQEAEA